MNTVIALYTAARIALEDRLTEEDGQTTMEWMGIAAIVVGILAVLLGNADDIGDMVQATFQRLFEDATTVP